MIWWILPLALVVLVGIYSSWRMIGSLTKIFLDLQIQMPYDEGPDLPGEHIVFEATDGISLPGLFIKSHVGDGRTVIFAPEFGADLGSYRKYAGHLIEAGYNLFAFEFRGHGPVHVSEGYIPTHWPTRYELKDLLGAIDFIRGHREVAPDKIALFGVSKGGCLTICAAAVRKPIAAVIADSAFSTRSTSLSYMYRWGPIFIRSEVFWRLVPHWFLVALQRVSMTLSGLLRGCRFISVSDYLKRWPGTPLFLIHGQRDSFIPCEQVDELKSYVSEGEARTWVVPKARHNESAIVAREEYQRRTVEFLNESIPSNSAS
jgi:pimeloyl-ACP methyl ester carboxylesterase